MSRRSGTTPAAPRAGYWVTMVLTPVIFLSAFTFFDAPPRLDVQLFHDHAAVLASNAALPAPPSAACPDAAVSLPYFAGKPRFEQVSTWFCLEFAATSPAGGRQALLMPDAMGNLSIYLNGWFVAETAPLASPLEHGHTEPLWFDLPPAALQPGRNVVQIRSSTEFGYGALFPLYIGEASALRPAYERLRLIRVDIVAATIATMVVVSLFMLGLFALRPRDTVYAWFAATIAIWAAQLYLSHTARPGLGSTHTWLGLHSLTLGWFVCLASVFVNRVTGPSRSQRLQEAAVLVFGLLGGLLRMWPYQDIHTATQVHLYFWVPGMLIIGVAMLWRLARASLSAGNEEARMLLLAAFLVFCVGVRDYAVDLNGGYRYAWNNLLPYTVGAVLTIYGFFLLKRLSGALTEAETLNHELEDRVAAKVREIEAAHSRLLQLERQQAAQLERERITRDMHDGIGGHLIQALAIAETDRERGALPEVLRLALADLRMVIDSSEQVDGDLAAVLAMMRDRCERRIVHGGLRFDWQVGDLPLMPDLGPHHVLQILRILDEALTNVVRHARATVVTVRARSHVGSADPAQGAGVLVEVEDNGRGFADRGRLDPAHGGDGAGGRGLRNMRQRAQAIGARLSIVAGDQGTSVQLLIALPPRVTEAG